MPLKAGAFLALAVLAQPQQAPPGVMRYVHNAPESALDSRYRYHWKILETALDKTTSKYGPYVLETASSMTEQRQRFELARPTGNRR